MLHKDFIFPTIYKEMNDLGWLDSRNEKVYLWLNDMEWHTIKEIEAYPYDEGECKNIIPFASTGGGDHWVWYIHESGETTIGLCYHDDVEGIYYAKTIEAAMFRQILEFLSNSLFYADYTEAKSYQYSLEEARMYLKKWRYHLNKYFPKEWLEELKAYEEKELIWCHTSYDDYYAVITPEEAQACIKKYLEFDLRDESFVWYKE